MTVKASASITLAASVDIESVWRYYLLRSSTLSAPTIDNNKIKPPTTAGVEWSDTEPSYSEGSTAYLYTVECTVYSDETMSYSSISKSSSYEAAKAAYAKAQAASEAAQSAQDSADNVKDQIVSMGEQLIINGNGLMGDNTNFSTLIFDASKANGSPGSFTREGATYKTPFSDAYIPINPNLRYSFEMDAISKNGLITMFSFLRFYDVDKKVINDSNHMYIKNTLTHLTQDLKNGDTVVHFNDLSGWNDTVTSTSQRGFIFWNYANSFGYTYPELTYSRNVWKNLYENSNVDKTNNTITLNAPWSNGTIEAGTKLSQCSTGGTYKYQGMVGSKVPTEWTHYYGFYDGTDYSGNNVSTKFPPGTAYAKVGFLWNYRNVDDQCWVTNISLKTDYDNAINEAKNAANTAQSTANSAQTAANTAQTAANNAQSTADTANNKIDNLEIGGRNLVLNSATILLPSSDHGNSGCSVVENDYVKIIPKNNGNIYNINGIKTSTVRQKGKEYTLSFEILTPTTIGFYWFPSESYSYTSYIQANDSWQKVVFTYTQTGNDSSSSFLFGLNKLIANETYCYRNIKLETGNRATDWTPAPEDVDAEIEEASKTATDFIAPQTSTLTDDGIKVFPKAEKDNPKNYTQINQNGVDIYQNGSRAASFGYTTTIGKASGNNVLIEPDSVNVRNGSTVLASFGANKIELGKNSEQSVIEMCGGLVGLKSAVETDAAGDPIGTVYLSPTELAKNKNYPFACGIRSAKFNSWASVSDSSFAMGSNAESGISSINYIMSEISGYSEFDPNEEYPEDGPVIHTHIGMTAGMGRSNGREPTAAIGLSANYDLTDSVETIAIIEADSIETHGVLYPQSNIDMPNNIAIRAKLSDGSSTTRLIALGNTDNLFIGNDTNNGAYLRIGNSKDFKVLASASDNELLGCVMYNGSRYLRSSPVYARTTSSAANVRVLDDGRIARSTASSIRYKEEITTKLDPDLNPERLYDLNVWQYKYRDGHIQKDDQRYGMNHIGLLAEDVKQHYPIAAEYNDDGYVDDWSVRYIVPAMLKLVQEQHKQIEGIEQKLKELTYERESNETV